MEELKTWCIFEEDTETPIFWGVWFIDLDKLPNITWWIYEYNQLEFVDDFWYCLCTAYWAIWAISSNDNKEIEEYLRYSIMKARTKVRFNPKEWWYLKDWADIVADFTWWLSYQIPKQRIKEFLDKWYRVSFGMYVWNDYKNYTQDWILTDEEILKIKDTKFWHCLTMKNNLIIDNYKWVLQDNTTEVDNIDKFINSWFVYDTAYLIIWEEIIRKVFIDKMTWDFTKDWDFVAELMKNKEIYPTEFRIAQKLLKDIYVNKTVKIKAP